MSRRPSKESVERAAKYLEAIIHINPNIDNSPNFEIRAMLPYELEYLEAAEIQKILYNYEVFHTGKLKDWLIVYDPRIQMIRMTKKLTSAEESHPISDSNFRDFLFKTLRQALIEDKSLFIPEDIFVKSVGINLKSSHNLRLAQELLIRFVDIYVPDDLIFSISKNGFSIYKNYNQRNSLVDFFRDVSCHLSYEESQATDERGNNAGWPELSEEDFSDYAQFAYYNYARRDLLGIEKEIKIGPAKNEDRI